MEEIVVNDKELLDRADVDSIVIQTLTKILVEFKEMKDAILRLEKTLFLS